MWVTVFQVLVVIIASIVMVSIFVLTIRGLLGRPFSWFRITMAGILSLVITQPIINNLAGSEEDTRRLVDQGSNLEIGLIVALGTAIGILVGITFLVIGEAILPTGTVPGPLYMARASRRWFHRTQRYAQISWVLLKHRILLGALGSLRAELRDPEDRRELARRFTAALNESGVTFIKLGQILSTRRDLLPVEFIESFSTLQTGAQPLPWEAMEPAISRALGSRSIAEVFEYIDEKPLASASIAQVHTARLKSGEDVVLKIRRPGIRRQVERDLDIVGRIAAQVERSTGWGKEVGARSLSEGFAAALREELDLSVEARNMRIIAAGQRPGDTNIPKVFSDISTHDLLVMERIHGEPLNDSILARTDLDRDALACSVFDSLLHQMLVIGTFHADPHPGNLMLMPDGRLTLLDFGSVGRIDKVIRQALMRMLLAWEFGDPVAATDALLGMVRRPADLDEYQLERDMGHFMANYIVPGATIDTQAVADLFGIVARNGLAMPPQLAAALRAIGTMEGTLSHVAPGFNIMEEARAFAERSMRDVVRPTNLRQMLTEELSTLLPMLQRLPRRIDRITAALEEGRLNVNVSPLSGNEDQRVVRSLMQELLLSVLAAASGVMAVMLIGQDTGPKVVPNMTMFQFMGYFLMVLAFILAMRVLVFIFRRA